MVQRDGLTTALRRHHPCNGNKISRPFPLTNFQMKRMTGRNTTGCITELNNVTVNMWLFLLSV